MRITVIVEDGEVTVSVSPQPAGAADTVDPATPAASAPATAEPPPDVLARALASGALSAGPAPAMPSMAGAPGTPMAGALGTPGTPPWYSNAGAGGTGAAEDRSAGAAPDFGSPPPTLVENGAAPDEEQNGASPEEENR